MKETQSELLNTQKSVGENQSKEDYGNEELRKIEKIENTPFHTVEENGKVYMVMGEYKLSERDYGSREQCIESELKTNMWHTIGKYLFAITDFKNKLEK